MKNILAVYLTIFYVLNSYAGEIKNYSPDTDCTNLLSLELSAFKMGTFSLPTVDKIPSTSALEDFIIFGDRSHNSIYAYSDKGESKISRYEIYPINNDNTIMNKIAGGDNVEIQLTESCKVHRYTNFKNNIEEHERKVRYSITRDFCMNANKEIRNEIQKSFPKKKADYPNFIIHSDALDALLKKSDSQIPSATATVILNSFETCDQPKYGLNYKNDQDKVSDKNIKRKYISNSIKIK